MAIKRLNYFDQQFLVVDDFKDEQRYHRDMRQRLTRGLHTPGIAEGLAVLKTGKRQVTVKPGVAIDQHGQEIVLEADRILDLSNFETFPPNATVHVTVAYEESPIHPSTDTRVTEEPKLEAKITLPPANSTVVRLAEFKLEPDVPGNLNASMDGGARQAAGSKLGPAAVAEPNLTQALRDKVNRPQGLASLGGVSNPGQGVDLFASSGITITPDNAAKKITIGQNVTAADIGALLKAEYEFRNHAFQSIRFDSVRDGTTAALPLPFQPRFVLAISNCSANLGRGPDVTVDRGGGTSVGFFDSTLGKHEQHCCGIAVRRRLDGGWIPDSAPLNAGICSARFSDLARPPLAEDLVVKIAVTPPGLVATLSRKVVPGHGPLTQFDLTINLFCMGP